MGGHLSGMGGHLSGMGTGDGGMGGWGGGCLMGGGGRDTWHSYNSTSTDSCICAPSYPDSSSSL